MDSKNKRVLKETKDHRKKMSLGVVVGILIFVVGFLVIIVSFVMNSYENYNPYKEPATYSPESIADTFVVPDGAKYNRAYHVFNYNEGKALFTYSKAMFSRHEIKDIYFKMEGGYVYQLGDKTYFDVYFYNLSTTDILNKVIDIEFIHYNKTKADKITYTIENLVPLACKHMEIEVDKKVINAYDYHISLS